MTYSQKVLKKILYRETRMEDGVCQFPRAAISKCYNQDSLKQ